MLDETDDSTPPLRYGDVPTGDAWATDDLEQRRGPPLPGEPRSPGEIFAFQDEREDKDRTNESPQPRYGREGATPAPFPLQSQEGKGQDGHPQLDEVVPDPADDHGEGAARPGEAPRGQDRIGQPDGHGSSGGNTVRNRGRRLGEDGRLRQREAGGRDHDHDPVGEEVPQRGNRKEPQLAPGERSHGLPYLREVGELSEDVPEDRHEQDERDEDLQRLLRSRAQSAAVSPALLRR